MGQFITVPEHQPIPNHDPDALREELKRLVPTNNHYEKIEIEFQRSKQALIIIEKTSIQIMDQSSFNRYLRVRVFGNEKFRGEPILEYIPTPYDESNANRFIEDRLQHETRLVLETCLQGENVSVETMKLKGETPICLGTPSFKVQNLVMDSNRGCRNFMNNMEFAENVEMELSHANVRLFRHPLIQNTNSLTLKSSFDSRSFLPHIESKLTTYNGNCAPEEIMALCEFWMQKALPIGTKLKLLKTVASFGPGAMIWKLRAGFTRSKCEGKSSITFINEKKEKEINIILSAGHIEVEIMKFGTAKLFEV